MTHAHSAILTPASVGVNEENTNNLVTIGETGRPHGLAGELKIRPIVDNPNRFAKLHHVILEAPDGRRARFTIRRIRNQNAGCIVSFHEVTSIEQAALWVRAEVKISQDALETLPDGEYYHFDLVGMDVFTESGACIGTIKDIFSTGSNDVFVVKKQDIEHLIPSTEEIVRHVDVKQKRMVIRPMEGLLEHDEV
ncbi:MAG: 16S rRNA processing protein RimM [Nitrospiraceae bacterium]|nr:16S rRNA processing protein RimM [Nitrospiraceae bacterium]|tara:strand:+ start:2870 stop:3451 length:582 start_codon:yes stop_codon:yes gene_type:complete